MAPSDSQRARQPGQCSVGAGETAGLSEAPSPQRRNDGQLETSASPLNQELTLANSESWVEVASQPSSSSLSSIGGEIVTTGLRVGSTSYPPRRRRSQQQHPMPASFIVGHPANQGGTTSSQEEYDETESEEDRVMTSSTEAIHPSANLLRQQRTSRVMVDTDSDSDDDENATALGRPSNTPVFRPQPNAFSHPPSHLTHRHSTGSAHPYHHPSSRPSMHNRAHTRSHRGVPNYMSPSYQADNDAALRASLTTLLSCAAAARGLPKHDERRTGAPGGPPVPGTGVVPSSQPMELRLVPESELMAESTPPPPPLSGPGAALAAPKTPHTRTASNSSAPSGPASPPTTTAPATFNEKTKRPSTTQSKPPRAAKKKRTALFDGPSPTTDSETSPFFTSISPTLLTWVVSAGVVVLVSVVGFGAGYVIGREVGRQEGAAQFLGGGGSAAAGNMSCGSELVRGGGTSAAVGTGAGAGTLRRIRWGGGGVRSVVA